jgi:hypothetical protein
MAELFDRLTDLDNLYNSFMNCKKGVDWKESVQRYESNLLQNINTLRKALLDGTYRQKAFFEFDINERGKKRHIKSMHISDRVLQRVLCDYVLNPVLFKNLIYDNGASVKGKGIEFSRKRLKVHLQRYYRKHGNKGWVLKIDFSKYFDSIPHDILKQKIREKIKDEKVIKLTEYLIDTFEGDCGVGIGSQLSQTAGIFYPTELDNFCKIVKGCKYYGRYMDDTYIIHEDKKFLQELYKEYQIISQNLGITINSQKTQIMKLEKGFIFLQMRYLLTETGKVVIIPVNKAVVRQRRKLKKLFILLHKHRITKEQIEEQYKSWRGNIMKYNAYKSVRNLDALYNILFGGKQNEKEKRNDTRRKTRRRRKHPSGDWFSCLGLRFSS